jgi:hypothetical protein
MFNVNNCNLQALRSGSLVLCSETTDDVSYQKIQFAGTVEWLPGSPLGNNGLSWSDVLMGWVWRVGMRLAAFESNSALPKDLSALELYPALPKNLSVFE